MLILDIISPMVRRYPNSGALAGRKKRKKEKGEKSTKREGERKRRGGDSNASWGIWLQMDDGEYKTSLGVTLTRSDWRRLAHLLLQNPLAGCSTHLLGGL